MGVYDSDDWRALVAAVKAAPDDDLPRLVAADFLEERGEADRAEFIRVQIELAAQRRGEFRASVENDRRQDELERREQELLSHDRSPLLGVRSRHRAGTVEYNPYGWVGVEGYAMDWCHFHRGFVEAVECSPDAWLRHGDEVCRRHSVRLVRFTAWPNGWEWGRLEASVIAPDSGPPTAHFPRWPGVRFQFPGGPFSGSHGTVTLNGQRVSRVTTWGIEPV